MLFLQRLDDVFLFPPSNATNQPTHPSRAAARKSRKKKSFCYRKRESPKERKNERTKEEEATTTATTEIDFQGLQTTMAKKKPRDIEDIKRSRSGGRKETVANNDDDDDERGL